MKANFKSSLMQFLKDKKSIFDIGSGPEGSYWWKLIDNDAKVTGIDVNFFPKKIPRNVYLYKCDAILLDQVNEEWIVEKYKNSLFGKFKREKVSWNNKFDLVICNHILEHVSSPHKVVKGIKKILSKQGLVYVGFPDSQNFTDIFYHLIHSEGGGHVQKLTKQSVLSVFNKQGFKLIHCNIWPDDWLWFQKFYDYKQRNIKYINQREIDYLANVFRKELTIEKGYFYGWEMVFQKQ